MRSSTLNYILYQVGWLALVLGAAREAAWIGVAIGLALIGLHLMLVGRVPPEVRLLALAGVTGAATDSLLVSTGLMSFSSGVVIDGLAPPWIVVMWIQFATTLRYSLRWLLERPRVAAASGAVGGPLAYLVGARLGAVSLAGPSTLIAIAGAWAVVLPWLVTVAGRDPAAGYRFERTTEP